MSSPQKQGDEDTTPPDTSTVILLLKSIGDTTWRMFVPTLGGTFLGVWLDSMFGTAPWLVIAGIALGVGATIILMINQFKKL